MFSKKIASIYLVVIVAILPGLNAWAAGSKGDSCLEALAGLLHKHWEEVKITKVAKEKLVEPTKPQVATTPNGEVQPLTGGGKGGMVGHLDIDPQKSFYSKPVAEGHKSFGIEDYVLHDYGHKSLHSSDLSLEYPHSGYHPVYKLTPADLLMDELTVAGKKSISTLTPEEITATLTQAHMGFASVPHYALTEPELLHDLNAPYKGPRYDQIPAVAKLEPEILTCKPAKGGADEPFGPFLYNGKKFDYDSLPGPAKKPTGESHLLYFGRKALYGKGTKASIQDAEDTVRRLFIDGVARANGHGDVYLHQGSTKNSKGSGFSILTEDFGIASKFATDTYLRDGLVFVIDANGLETLNITEFKRHEGIEFGKYDHEREILGRGGRNPRRIKAAIWFERGKPVKTWLNPNYEPQATFGDRVQSAARRLLDPEHWERARQKAFKQPDQSGPPMDYYGSEAMNDWIQGLEYVESHCDKSIPSVEDLSHLNLLVLKSQKLEFKAYYLSEMKKVPSALRSRYLSWVSKSRWAEISKEFGIDLPHGKVRENGTIRFGKGKTIEDGDTSAHLFTDEQIAALRKNPYITIHSIEPAHSGLKRVEYTVPEEKQVRKLLDEAYSTMRSGVFDLKAKKGRVSQGEYERDAALVAARFYHSLVSIHPFWDGAGRTAKLARDWVLLHLKVPPPESTPSNDFELTPEQLAADILKGIEETRKVSPDGKLRISQPILKAVRAGEL